MALAALVLGGALLAFLGRSSPSNTASQAASSAPAPAMATPRLRLAQARQLLARGEFLGALAEAEAAGALHAHEPDALSARERLALGQLRREAALLADLSAESLEEILRHAAGLPGPEWEATFRRRYRGKSVVLDTEVARTAAGRYRPGWRIRSPAGEGELKLDGLKLLDALSLEAPERLVFGARLSSAHREAPGGWVVRLEPDSGVLLTDPEAAALCCPALADATSRELLLRQRRWALDEPAGGTGIQKE
jgi:hypothetical protein